jgi:chorismate mutase / prephenate dehydrogenase
MDLEALRKDVADIDMEILALMKRRTETVAEIGKTKMSDGTPVRNIPVEDKVAGRYRSFAKENGMDPDATEEIARILIRKSVEVQCALPHPDHIRRRVSVVGGAGKMGKWFADMLSASGNEVSVIDPASDNGLSLDSAAESDAVIIAVPIAATEKVLAQLDPICRQDALIFDLSSLKSPFIGVLKEMAARRKVCSVHPMFGPSARSMYDRNLIVCDCGNMSAVNDALELIGDRGACVRVMDVSAHDKYMSYVLGLSHAVNIAFFTVLERSGFSFKDMCTVASTTFRKNMETNASVALEDPRLYYEIQHLNDARDTLWSAFTKAVKDLEDASMDDDPRKFTALMDSGREYFECPSCIGRGT